MSALEEVLEAHTVEDYSGGEYDGDASLLCSCGHVAYGSDLYDAEQNRRAHLVDAIRAWAASDEVVERAWEVLDDHGHNGIDCRPRSGFDLSIRAALEAAFGERGEG